MCETNSAEDDVMVAQTGAMASADALRLGAYDQMEFALRALDAVGEATAAAHLDLAIVSLGLRSPKRQRDMVENLSRFAMNATSGEHITSEN
jgi:hypothetical protein